MKYNPGVEELLFAENGKMEGIEKKCLCFFVGEGQRCGVLKYIGQGRKSREIV